MSDPAAMRAMRKDWGELQKGVASVSREVGSVLNPALARVGIASLGVGAAIGGIAAQLNSFAGGMQSLGRLSRETGIAANELQKFQSLGERSGVPLQEFGAGLTEFTGKLRRFRERTAAESWQLRNMGPEGEKIAESIATSVSNEQAFERALAGIRSIRSASGQRTLARLLFGTDNFAELGRRFSPEIMAEIAKNLGDIPKGALGAAEAWNTAFDNLKEAAIGARNELAMEGGLLGSLTDLVNGFREFAMNKDPETGFSNIQRWAEEAKRAVNELWKAMNTVADFLAGNKNEQQRIEDNLNAPRKSINQSLREWSLQRQIADKEGRIEYNRQNRLSGAVPPAEFDRRNEELTEELKKLREELEQLRLGRRGTSGGVGGGLSGVGGGIRDAVKGIFGGGAASGIGGGMGGIGPAARMGGGGSTASIGHAVPWSVREPFIREEARKRGLNPDDMVAIARTEGAGKYSGDFMGGQYRSFGDFQLYTGGGEGNRFAKATGLDPRNPKTWREQTQFALNRIVELGHTDPWNGPKNAGIAGRINAGVRAAAARGLLRKFPIGSAEAAEGGGEGKVLGRDRNGNPIRLHKLPPREGEEAGQKPAARDGDEMLSKARGSPFKVDGNASVDITINSVSGQVSKTKTSVDGLFKDVKVNKGRQMQMAE